MADPKPHPSLTSAELRESGLLQEANRRFFHPLGLALAVEIGGDHDGRLRVLDDRDDPEGFYFDGDALDGFVARAGAVAAEWRRRAAPRRAALGYVVQPAADPAAFAGLTDAELDEVIGLFVDKALNCGVAGDLDRGRLDTLIGTALVDFAMLIDGHVPLERWREAADEDARQAQARAAFTEPLRAGWTWPGRHLIIAVGLIALTALVVLEVLAGTGRLP